MSLRVGSLLRPLLGHSASCCSAGVATPPAAGPFGLLLFCGGHHSARCSSCDLLFCGGHHSARWDTYKCPFGGPQHLCAARRSTNNDRLYQELHRGCQPLSTIAFAAFAALYLQQSLSPPLRPSTFNNRFGRFCGRDCVLSLSVRSAAAGSPSRQLDYQPLHSTFNNRFRLYQCQSYLAAAPRSIGRDSVGNLRRRCCTRSRRDSSVNSSVPAGRVATPPAAGSGRYSASSFSVVRGSPLRPLAAAAALAGTTLCPFYWGEVAVRFPASSAALFSCFTVFWPRLLPGKEEER